MKLPEFPGSAPPKKIRPALRIGAAVLVVSLLVGAGVFLSSLGQDVALTPDQQAAQILAVTIEAGSSAPDEALRAKVAEQFKAFEAESGCKVVGALAVPGKDRADVLSKLAEAEKAVRDRVSQTQADPEYFGVATAVAELSRPDLGPNRDTVGAVLLVDCSPAEPAAPAFPGS
jgi:hypothetical protein